MLIAHEHAALRLPVALSRRVRSRQGGFTIVEIMVVVAVACIILAIALPMISQTITSMHLSSASSSLSGAMVAARYQALSTGCSVQIVVSNQTYQVWAKTVTIVAGNPPACSASYSNVSCNLVFSQASPCASTSNISYATPDVTLASFTPTVSPSQTLQFNSSGVVSGPTTGTTAPIPTTFSIQLALNSATTKTVTVSGVGSVKTTAP
jgi:prepilin-type N-terminal cleavage/methylation domain-containing protein